MSEWWTYQLSDFLMFSPATYWRMVEQYNRDLWPAQLVGLAIGAAALWLVASGREAAARVKALLLAAVWLWIGWAFYAQRYASINLAAVYLAVAFAVQALLLLLMAVMPHEIVDAKASAMQKAGWLLAGTGLLLYPFLSIVSGRPWAQAEVFGSMPEPTALTTLGLLMAGRCRPRTAIRWLLLAIPAASFAFGFATLMALAGA